MKFWFVHYLLLIHAEVLAIKEEIGNAKMKTNNLINKSYKDILSPGSRKLGIT